MKEQSYPKIEARIEFDMPKTFRATVSLTILRNLDF